MSRRFKVKKVLHDADFKSKMADVNSYAGHLAPVIFVDSEIGRSVYAQSHPAPFVRSHSNHFALSDTHATSH